MKSTFNKLKRTRTIFDWVY